ncbi:ribonuclease H1 domain-containing protein [Streptococcus constellatus subsp. viborgensis]|uniref:ribonuclease H1 domain-containing protein n=1 Tax=Streptococcus constellatus TaxID=76860 RepID=UPI0018E15D1A|nr:viroplasmin family protein [Streptococcus constellatus]QQC23044.1 type II toxin-antitoxin system RnlA family toxin [Streptococcus constellatus]
MAKKKFYAVRVGKIPGIYQTWSQAEEQVKGFPGAEYKSFSTEEEAIRYMSREEIKESESVSDETSVINEKIEQEIKNLQDGEVIAFVDGSHSLDADGKEKYSFGVLLITSESEDSLYKAFVDKAYMDSRNIAGEIEGVKQAILWAIESNKQRIKIFYDYEGIEKWATKEWKSKVKVSQEYSKFFDEKSKLINIEFEHVKAHSGIVYNEKVDELAKRALLSQGYKTYNDGSIYFIGFQKQDWLSMVESLNNEINEKDIKNKIEVEESNPKDYLDKLLLMFDGQRVIINCYKGNKSYVQGKQSLLFQKIISLAIEKLPTDNAVIEVLNTYHALTVEESEVENAFSAILPNFPMDDKDTKLRNTLLSAVFNTLIIGYMPDYTCLVTPLFRAMEFYLHRILSDKLGQDTTTLKGKNKFSYFGFNNLINMYEYNSSKGNLNNNQIDYLNELYNRYNKMRHPYAHWAADSMDTQVITDVKTAHDLILEGLQFVNKYYIIF